MIPFSFQLQNGDKGFVWQHEEGESYYRFAWGFAKESDDVIPFIEKRPKYSLITLQGFMEQLCFAIELIYDSGSSQFQKQGAFQSELNASHITDIIFGEQKIDTTESLHAALKNVMANKSLASEVSLFRINLNVRFAPIQSVQSHEERAIVINCNRLSLINACLLQSLANYSLGYGKSVINERTMDKVEWISGWQSSLKRAFKKIVFSGQANLTMAVSKLLSLYEGGHGTELLLVDDKFRRDCYIDWDIANVIEMVVNRHHRKQTYCLVLTSLFFSTLTLDNMPLLVRKLSFLCHGGTQISPFYSYYQKKMKFLAELAKSMPLLETIVLRQCFASGDDAPWAIKFNPELFKPRHIQQVSKHENIEAKQLQCRQFLLQQQKTADKQIITNVRYYDISGCIISESLNDIPLNLAAPSISAEVEQALAARAKSRNWPPIDFAANKMAINHIHQCWEKNISLSREDKRLYKASTAKASTFRVNEFPSGNVASALHQQLENHRNNVSIKAYYGWYSSFFPCVGAINSTEHGYKDRPKALYVSPAP